jgi:DNA-binding MarR family transcriptional regulator
MTRAEAPIPIGQYIGEAEGALTGLLEGALQGADLTRTEYIALQILAQRGPFEVPRELHQLLVDARQLRLDGSGVAQLLDEVERKGLVVGTSLDAAGPVQLTDQGKELHAKVTERVVSITKRLLADFDRADLETTRRVLVELVERAKTLE